MVSFDRPHRFPFLLVFHCTYVSIFRRFRYIITYFLKFNSFAANVDKSQQQGAESGNVTYVSTIVDRLTEMT